MNTQPIKQKQTMNTFKTTILSIVLILSIYSTTSSASIVEKQQDNNSNLRGSTPTTIVTNTVRQLQDKCPADAGASGGACTLPGQVCGVGGYVWVPAINPKTNKCMSQSKATCQQTSHCECSSTLTWECAARRRNLAALPCDNNWAYTSCTP
jgi:hypothetical protein